MSSIFSRCSDNDVSSSRDIPSFIEPRPPLISNPFMRPRPQKGTNLMELFEEDSECEEPELVQVYLRMKPCDVPNNVYEVRSEHHLITSLDKVTAGHGRRTQTNVSKLYTFSRIFQSKCSQKEIFETVVKNNLKKLPEGHSFTLLTYGASGSGKTYTLMGTVQAPGLVPRSLEYLFRIVEAAQHPLYKPVEGSTSQLSYEEQEYELQWVKKLRQVSAPLRDKYRRMSAQLVSDLTQSNFDLSGRIKHYVWVSFIEIYNEGIYDLLVPGDRRASSTLRIREDSDGNVFVKGATQAFVRSGSEAYDVLVAGKHNLQVAATGVHARSSRSHCIFTITMLTETDSGVRSSAVRLCDLAGCERAIHTRNTGTRLAESKAINSSLHVLERCLHTLRRRGKLQAGLVPYRESKLTRLLGAGLSGARGEAVSMVVTLNPRPEYAVETKHVLQLAAVARDIQINNTMADTIVECTLESSNSDSTITSSAEVMKLRSENERLHFELLQSQARNKELMSSMELKQQETAATMRELVEEAKDMTRQYYEAQIHALQTEMEEMMEEYESRLSNLAKPLSETPNRLQNQVTQLLTQVAILEEKLVAERLARVRAEEEVQHLRACIDERDEKSRDGEDQTETTDEGVTSLTESEDESDICNESLEPTFKKEEINRSRLILRQSMMSDINNTTNRTNHTLDQVNEHGSDIECSNDTIKDKDITFEANKSCEGEQNITATDNTGVDESGYNLEKESEIHYDTVSNGMEISIDEHKQEPLTRGTYFVRKSEVTLSDDSNVSIEAAPTTVKKNYPSRDTYYVSDKDNSNNVSGEEKHLPEDSFEDIEVKDGSEFKQPMKMPQPFVSKILKNVKASDSIDNSLIQFEKLEKAAKACIDTDKVSDDFASMKLLKHKKPFLNEPIVTDDQISEDKPIAKLVVKNDDEINVINKKQTFFPEKNFYPPNDSDSKSSDIKESDSTILIKSKAKDTNKTYFENIPTIQDKVDSISKNNSTIEDQGRCEIVHTGTTPTKSVTKDTNEKTFFEDYKVEINVTEVLKSIGKKTYFDNLDGNVREQTSKNTRVDDIKMILSDDRSPSIVKDNVEGNVELSKIKKLLGESFTLQTGVKSVNHVAQPKKHNSIDLFESPQVNTKVKDQIEEVRKSIDELKLVKTDEHKSDDVKLPEINVELVDLETNERKETDNKVEESLNNTKANNTVEEFEHIYKDITAPRATEFDLLVSEINEPNLTTDKEFKEPSIQEIKYNLRKTQTKHERDENNDEKGTEQGEIEKPKTEKKYRLRNLHAYEAISESETKPSKRNLRLRRRKNQDDDNSDTSQDNSKDKLSDVNAQTKTKAKLKDIVNLQSEFSDVTMDVPAPEKKVQDIPSPEKNDVEDENIPPNGIQSCPSKSITRSRRKLFTPRPEPLDESTNGNSGERVRVPRPSYKGPRARRRL